MIVSGSKHGDKPAAMKTRRAEDGRCRRKLRELIQIATDAFLINKDSQKNLAGAARFKGGYVFGFTSRCFCEPET
jgi:hypothetical protein